ncbi:MAG: hypothetical protein JSV26_02475 [bacterium]|nr:MAG: hypothetical protein JSV26_02475 [bacterium]
MRRSSLVLIIFLLVCVPLLGEGVAAGTEPAEGQVVGRILGVDLTVPYLFKRDMRYQNSLNPYRPRIRGFTIVGRDSGFRKRLSTDRRGFFVKTVPAGNYSLIRSRVDRDDWKGEKTISILDFSVAPGQLVNLGTIDIVHGEPVEIYRYDFGSHMEGRYLYRYHYGRDDSEQGFSAPLDYLRERKKGKSPVPPENQKTVRDYPTASGDSSRIEMKVYSTERTR